MRLTPRLVKVAVTPEVDTVVVPDRVAPWVPVPGVMLIVTGTDVAEDTALPYESCTDITG